MAIKLTVDGTTYTVQVADDVVTVDGGVFKVKRDGTGNLITVVVDGRPYKVDLSGTPTQTVVDGRAYVVSLEGKAGRAKTPVSPTTARGKAAASGSIRALMPGKITSMRIREGDAVTAGDILCTLEAMKMENEVRCPIAGTVKSISISVGSTVDKGDTLAVVE